MSDNPVTPAPLSALQVELPAYRWMHFSILALALLLRLIIFPHADETRDLDEAGYLKGSLAMLEGVPAGYKAAPAGPNLWVGWLYTGGVAALDLLRPGPEERLAPMQIRPFVALEHALFEQYHDLSRLHELWIITQLMLALWAVSAAYRMGLARGGLAGGILLGGFLAVLPLFVDFTMMSRPYMTAWCFGVLALHSAMMRRGPARSTVAGIFLGLAISSRVEMLLFAPLVLWEFWHRPPPGRLLAVWIRVIGVSVVTTLLVAPWLLTHLIGNLRTIASVRLGPNPHGATTLAGILLELAWTQGLFGAMLAFAVAVAGLCLPGSIGTDAIQQRRAGDRWRVALLGIYAAMLLMSLGHGTIFLHQQGPVVLALIFFGAFAAGYANRFAPKAAAWGAVAMLAVPLVSTLRLILRYHLDYAPDPSVAWIAAHVPAGTIVYNEQGALQQPLPTPACAKAKWDEVTDDSAWRRKFQAGMERFHVVADQIPRALSEENLIQERGNRRGFFILGGRTNLPEPRFDVRSYSGSPVFDVPDVFSAFAQTGGVLVLRGRAKPADLGKPAASWTNGHGASTCIFCSPDVQAKLEGR